VHEFATASEQAYRNLWAYLSGIDVIEEILLRDRPVDEPVRWLLADGRNLQQTHTGDYLWLRLLDVPAALAARAYAVPGRLVLEVHDNDLGGYGAGRFLLDADAGGATCTSTSLRADLRVSQRVLASVYLGGLPLRLLKLAGAVDELTPGAIDRADMMFASALAPWNATGF
jgi:predicted acetyltransferase